MCLTSIIHCEMKVCSIVYITESAQIRYLQIRIGWNEKEYQNFIYELCECTRRRWQLVCNAQFVCTLAELNT